MTSPGTCRCPHRRGLLLGGLLLALLGTGGFLLLRGPRYEKHGPLHCIVDGDLLYTFDASWRVETVRRSDPATGLRTVVVGKPDQARLAAFRGALLKELGLPALDAVPAEKKTDLDAARALGYL